MQTAFMIALPVVVVGTIVAVFKIVAYKKKNAVRIANAFLRSGGFPENARVARPPRAVRRLEQPSDIWTTAGVRDGGETWICVTSGITVLKGYGTIGFQEKLLTLCHYDPQTGSVDVARVVFNLTKNQVIEPKSHADPSANLEPASSVSVSSAIGRKFADDEATRQVVPANALQAADRTGAAISTQTSNDGKRVIPYWKRAVKIAAVCGWIGGPLAIAGIEYKRSSQFRQEEADQFHDAVEDAGMLLKNMENYLDLALKSDSFRSYHRTLLDSAAASELLFAYDRIDDTGRRVSAEDSARAKQQLSAISVSVRGKLLSLTHRELAWRASIHHDAGTGISPTDHDKATLRLLGRLGVDAGAEVVARQDKENAGVLKSLHGLAAKIPTRFPEVVK
jgi:hypothetical protein